MRMRFNTVLCVAVAVLLNLAGSFCQLDVCGRAPLNTKATNKATATAGSWPWQVNIQQISTGTHLCSGSLINKEWILTQAKCTIIIGYSIIYIDKSDLIINLGHENHQGPNPHEVNRTVIQIIKHPNFTVSSFHNDIALLQLSSPVTFTDYIRPVCLAAAGSVFDDLPSWATGWAGTIGGGYSKTDDLLETEAPVLSNPYCNAVWKPFPITDNMLCAGILNYTGTSRCAGDFGGPLVIKQGFRWIQSGVTFFSSGYVCFYNPANSMPVLYTRVSQYQEWINTQIASDKPGFVFFPQSTPPTTPYIPDTTTYIPDTTPYIPDPTPYIPDPTSDIDDDDDCIHDIFSGSSLSLHSYPISFTFSIISLIFGLFMKVV